MSESPEKQPERKPQRSGNRSSSNPLAGSALFSSAADPVANLPELPEEAPATPPVRKPSPASGEQRSSLMYNTPPPPDYILRQFEQRHDRQTIYIDARKAGALDALVKLVARGNKTDLVDEMVSDILEKHAQALQNNEELVGILEERYRRKHNL